MEAHSPCFWAKQRKCDFIIHKISPGQAFMAWSLKLTEILGGDELDVAAVFFRIIPPHFFPVFLESETCTTAGGKRGKNDAVLHIWSLFPRFPCLTLCQVFTAVLIPGSFWSSIPSALRWPSTNLCKGASGKELEAIDLYLRNHEWLSSFETSEPWCSMGNRELLVYVIMF